MRNRKSPRGRKITSANFFRDCFAKGARHVSNFADRFAGATRSGFDRLHRLLKAVLTIKQKLEFHKAFANYRLKPLKVPAYGGDKTKFEECWGLFECLVDPSKKPVNLKMARLRQCLFGSTLETIRVLGFSGPEYEEAKEILTT